jgi:hypothetical protein
MLLSHTLALIMHLAPFAGWHFLEPAPIKKLGEPTQ